MISEVRAARLAGGLELPYVERGGGSGVPLVLLHGYVESWRSFELLLPLLPPWIRAFAVSQRGHGGAGRPPSGYGVGELAADAAAFMDAVGLETAVLVGSSSGGLVAQRFAVDHPGRALGLALLGTPRRLAESPAVSEFAAALGRLDDPIDPGFAREFVEGTMSQPVPPAFLEAMIGESLKVPASVWRATLRVLLEALPAEAGAIAAPTLLIWGDRDAFVSRADQEALAAAIPGSQLVVYEGAGHAVLWEEPERVAADVADFVTRIVKRG